MQHCLTGSRVYYALMKQTCYSLFIGIYVEQVGGNVTENIYTSLLGIGDELLEVNGEKVIGLSLDQVTCLMTRESTATVRILPHRWIQQ